ncbi:hypothetical protein ACWEO1_20350 [Kitasatospora cineracea]
MKDTRAVRTARFAAAYALLRVGADVGDHIVQSDHCARTKGATDTAPVTGDDGTVHGTAAGRRACAVHAASLGVARVEWPGKLMAAQLSDVPQRVAGARQVSRTMSAIARVA